LSPLREHPSPPVDATSKAVVGQEAADPTTIIFDAGRRLQQPLSPLVVNGRPFESDSRPSTIASPPVIIRLGSKHCHGALKRPLSEPTSPGGLATASAPATACDVDSEAPTGVRRPLARPRSITLGVTLKPEMPCSPSSTSLRTPSPPVLAVAPVTTPGCCPTNADFQMVPINDDNMHSMSPPAAVAWSRPASHMAVPKIGVEAVQPTGARGGTQDDDAR
jgi:hypothetical protein